MSEERQGKHPQSRLIVLIVVCACIAAFIDSIHLFKYLGSATLVFAFIANASKQDDLSREEELKWWAGLSLWFAYGWTMAVLNSKHETADLHQFCEQLREYVFPLFTAAFFSWYSKQSRRGTMICVLGAVGLISVHAGEIINGALMLASVPIAFLALESVGNLYLNKPDSKMQVILFWVGLALVTYPS